MPVPTNNSAGRLHALLEKFQQAASRKGAHVSVLNIWTIIWDCEPQDIFALYKHLIAFQELTRQVRQEVSIAPNADESLFLRSFSRVEEFASLTNLDVSWQSVGRSFDEMVLTELAFCAHFLDLIANEEVLPTQELDSLFDEINSLIEQIKTSPLEEKIQRTLLTILETVRHSTALYSIHGAEAFRRALAFGLGELMLHKELVDQPQNKEEVNKVLKILATIGKFASQSKNMIDMIKTGIEVKGLISGVNITSTG